MDAQKEIEKIAKIIQKGEMDRQAGELDCKEFSTDTIVDVGLQRLAGAKALVNAGYGDVKQAVNEFAEKLKNLYQLQRISLNAALEKIVVQQIKDTYVAAISILDENIKEIDQLVKEVCGE